MFLFFSRFGACVLCAGTPGCNSDAVRNYVTTLMNVGVFVFFFSALMFLVYAASPWAGQFGYARKRAHFFFASFFFVPFGKFTWSGWDLWSGFDLSWKKARNRRRWAHGKNTYILLYWCGWPMMRYTGASPTLPQPDTHTIVSLYLACRPILIDGWPRVRGGRLDTLYTRIMCTLWDTLYTRVMCTLYPVVVCTSTS